MNFAHERLWKSARAWEVDENGVTCSFGNGVVVLDHTYDLHRGQAYPIGVPAQRQKTKML